MRDQALAALGLAQARAGVFTAAADKIQRVTDPALRGAAWRNAASVLAHSDDQIRLKRWVEAISPVDHQLLAFLGVAEGLSAPPGEPDEQSPSAIAAAE